jgi:uncharacterized MnhB-related membrane protein
MMWIFDTLMLGMLLFTAWRAIAAPTLFGCAVAFISFGLLMSLAWLRLGAPDVALAEAAVGAGVTGSLLLSSLGRLRNMGKDQPGEKP